MSSHTDRDRTIALAGLFQAAWLVQRTGQGLQRDAAATRSCIESIFITDPPDSASVYGGLAALRTGLEVLTGTLASRGNARDLELTACVVTLLHLERKLSRRHGMLETLAAGITRIGQPQVAIPDGKVVAALAELYQQTISTMTPRVMVRGEPVILASPEAQRMIRALLLAGIRAAVLWRQCGGNRLRLIFGRRRLLAAARKLAAEAAAQA